MGVSMETQAFEVLEGKIDQALDLITNLQKENQTMKLKLQEMNKLLQEKENTVIKLREESEQARTMEVEINQYQEKEDRIRNKVETLLDKLKEFEEIE